MRYSLLFLLLFDALFSFDSRSYKPLNGCIKLNQKEFKLLREFTQNDSKLYLVVDTSSLQSYIFKNISKPKPCQNSRYQHLVKTSATPPYPLQNDGIKSSKSGLFVTTDLCPSSKRGYEQRLYQGLIDNFQNPVPVTIFVTKRWIKKHQKEFNQLKSWDNSNRLSITWGNHTAYHHYSPKAPYNRNFVLLPKENLKKDILDLEIELLKRGVIPSVFFRFPGLVSDKKSINIVKSLGLITIGTNCWLAKGQKIKSGSIILVHGNKNEPKGVDMLLKLIKSGKIQDLNSIKELKK
jgi:hypothetical protein